MIDFKEYFQQRYQGRESFLENIVFPIFGEENFVDQYDQSVLDLYPELQVMAEGTGIASIVSVGTIQVDFNPINIFDITVSSHVLMTRNRVGIQQIIRRIMPTFSSAFMLFHYEDADNWDWRFTFCSKARNSEQTDKKRYTFLLGPNQSCRTVADNFKKLLDKDGEIELKDIEEAFDVEALSDEFFGKYKNHYERFVQYVTGKRFVKIGGKWEEKTIHEPHPQMYDAFGKNDKRVRDYVKKMLGRIVFLHFLQKKGWMGVPQGKEWGDGDVQFMLHLFEYATDEQKANFLDEVLEPLFADALDCDRTTAGDLFETHVALPEGSKVKIPYLNGGLFERDELDKIDTRFPSEYFEDLFNFLYQYNFTIDENDPDDAQVGVDPEMLGRIFENLLEDNKDKGAYYTPKEIVKYMCRRSLVAYLETGIKDETQKKAIDDFVSTYDVEALGGNQSDLALLIDQRLQDVKICDPAIGSGAFPMGLLKELFLCRGAIENFENAAEIKRHIIQRNIYGVDLERGAVDIARLRFWLSLVVDEDTPHTLPNLDFKIMQGNSLLEFYEGVDLRGIAGSVDNTIIFEDDTCSRTFIRNWLAQYFDVQEHSERLKLRAKIDGAVKNLLVSNNYALEGRLDDVEIAGNELFFLWHTWFHDVFNRENAKGFDIVIGNPPYVSAPAQIANPVLAEQRQRIIDCGDYETIYQKWDLYLPFMERGLKMLCKNGCFSMIVPFPLSNQLYGQKFRKWVVSHYDVFEVTDLNGTKIFQNATVSNMILFAKNDGKTSEIVISHIDEHRVIAPSFVQPIIQMVQDEKKAVWNFTQQDRNTQLHSDMNVLGDYCYISVGMVLNADEKKAKGEFSKEDLISEVRDELHPREYIEAKDIEKYQVKRVRFLEYDTPRCPGKLRRPTFKELYEKDKIVINRLGHLQTILDNGAHYLLSDSTFMAVLWKDLKTVINKSINASVKRYSKLSRLKMQELSSKVSLEYLLALLNSRYADKLLANLRGDDYHIYPEHIRNIPIPKASEKIQEEIGGKVLEIMKLKRDKIDTSSLENKIDFLVYHLYGLNYDEVLVVDPNPPFTREEYEAYQVEQ